MNKYFTKFLNCGRNSLRHIIRVYNIKDMYVPYYTCPSVWQAIRKENCKIKFYHIDRDFLPINDFPKNSYVLYTNYFGINSKNVIYMTNKYKNLIVDNAQAYFMPQTGLAGFNSVRKFIAVPDGSIVYTTIETNLNYERDNSFKNMKLTDFRNRNFNINDDIKFVSEKTQELLKNININKEARLKHFYEFDKKYKNTNLLKIKLSEFDVPYVYPYLSEEKINYHFETYWSPQPINTVEGYFQKYLKGFLL